MRFSVNTTKQVFMWLILFQGSAALAVTNVALRIWTSKTGEQITANFSHYSGDGTTVVLSDGKKEFKIKASSLSKTDYDFLQTLNSTTRWDKPAEVAKCNEQTKAERSAELIEELSSCIPDAPQQGRIGRILYGEAHLDQVIDENSALITYKWGAPSKESKRQVMLIGVQTSGKADDTSISLPGEYVIDGTISFETAGGAKRTVLVMRPVEAVAQKSP